MNKNKNINRKKIKWSLLGVILLALLMVGVFNHPFIMQMRCPFFLI